MPTASGPMPPRKRLSTELSAPAAEPDRAAPARMPTSTSRTNLASAGFITSSGVQDELDLTEQTVVQINAFVAVQLMQGPEQRIEHHDGVALRNTSRDDEVPSIPRQLAFAVLVPTDQDKGRLAVADAWFVPFETVFGAGRIKAVDLGELNAQISERLRGIRHRGAPAETAVVARQLARQQRTRMRA